ncbi:MAG TPA: protease complex subunit PrcB family protein [Thermoanaerobaculia bacterium]|jgi:hypothetical protein|nr:protease complex subunit PrcB family protein [Thermoanaerobaculia bacterium]
MRAALLWAVLAMANTCTTAKVAENAGAENVEISTIARGGYAAQESERKAVLSTNDDDYRRQWKELIGESEIPNVDFGRGVVVFLLGGMRNTGGWSVQPTSARVEADGTAVIDAKVKGPPPGGITTQAITYPYAVIVVKSRDVKKVNWPE